jgi:hypothetical protein
MKPGPLTNWAIDVEAPGVRWLPEGPWTRGRLGTRLDCRIMVPLRTWRCRMRAISELLGQDLRCMERDNPSWPDSWQLGTEHELQMGDEAVARLRFQSGMPSDAELAGYRWTFEYRRHDGEGPQQWSLLRALGFPISPARGFLVAKDEESRDVAFFYLRKHGGTVEFRDGHELGLERWWTPMWPM